jgi:hypothetical protein
MCMVMKLREYIHVHRHTHTHTHTHIRFRANQDVRGDEVAYLAQHALFDQIPRLQNVSFTDMRMHVCAQHALL